MSTRYGWSGGVPVDVLCRVKGNLWTLRLVTRFVNHEVHVRTAYNIEVYQINEAAISNLQVAEPGPMKTESNVGSSTSSKGADEATLDGYATIDKNL